MFDCHFHIDPALVSCAGLIASMDAAGIERIALIARVNPAFELPQTVRYLTPVYRNLLHSSNCLMHGAGLQLYQSGVTDDGGFKVLNKRYDVIFEPDNAQMVAWLEQGGERFFGYIFLNPENSLDPLELMATYGQHPRVIGVKLHPYWHNYPLGVIEDIAAYCSERHWLLLVHLGVQDYADFKTLPRRFPKVPFIYCHGGVPYLRDVCMFAHEQSNVYVDISGSAFMSPGVIHRIIQLAGVRKVLFGSDGPLFHAHGDRFDFSVMQRLLWRQRLSRGDYLQVAGRNFMGLLSGG